MIVRSCEAFTFDVLAKEEKGLLILYLHPLESQD